MNRLLSVGALLEHRVGKAWTCVPGGGSKDGTAPAPRYMSLLFELSQSPQLAAGRNELGHLLSSCCDHYPFAGTGAGDVPAEMSFEFTNTDHLHRAPRQYSSSLVSPLYRICGLNPAATGLPRGGAWWRSSWQLA